MTTGYHARLPEQAEDPERVAIREALAFGQALYGQRRTLDLSVAGLALSVAGLTATLDADMHLTAGHDLGSVRFEPHAA